MATGRNATLGEPTSKHIGMLNYDCPHCSRTQIVQVRAADFKAARVTVWQCLSCTELQVHLQHMTAANMKTSVANTPRGSSINLYPQQRLRPPVHYSHVPAEIESSYKDACHLLGIHAGAAGAYARRSLELLLDGMGYQAKTILDSIKLARTEPDYDKRLPKRYLERLDYIKEVGNFALHIRRDHELAIIEVDKEQVGVCLDIVEALFDYVFEDPGQQYARAVEMNEALKKAGKKELPLPEAPGWLWSEAAAHAELSEEGNTDEN